MICIDYYFTYINIKSKCLDTSILNDDLLFDEIHMAISLAPTKKSCGPDNIYEDYFKHPNLIPFIIQLFRTCFLTSCFPNL